MTPPGERNPFVGPRPIGPGEPLFGRDDEVRGLYERLQARRIVVLHSPSGAGKSSLVQAGLIPRLREGQFDVWKPIRVNLDPRDLPGVPAGTNRYLLSAMVSLEEELPQAHRRSPGQLAALDLVDYLEHRPRRKGRAGRPVVLLFDQFEEVLTIEPHAVGAKEAFFDAVGRALDSGRYWALFIIREDHLAAFTPYRDRIPTQFTNTFRLDLLGLEGAREAATELAASGGRSFPAVDRLVRDLSMVKAQQPDGSFAPQPGLHVEPVHLQVVCRRLWEAMPPDDPVIDDDDVDAYADVSTALAGYYSDAVEAIADGDPVAERSLREWVGHQLIVGGIRSQVRQEKDRSGGLDNSLIEGLLARYIVRSEPRAGATWFELGHDRLVEPITRDNEEWERRHLHPMQVQAKLWEQERRSPALLLAAAALPAAEAWAHDNAALITDGEQEFLAASKVLRSAQRRRRLMSRVITISTGITAVVVAALGMLAWQRRGEAIAAQAQAQQERNEAHDARAVAMEASERARRASLLAGAHTLLGNNHGAEASLLLREAQTRPSFPWWIQATIDVLRREAQTPASFAEWIQVANDVLLREAQTPAPFPGWIQAANDVLLREFPISTRTHHGAVYSAEWSPDGNRILTASADDIVRVWKANGSGDPLELEGHRAKVLSARWSPDGNRILSASADGTARLWNADGSGEPTVLAGGDGPLVSAEWHPEGRAVVTTSSSGRVREWSLDDREHSTLVEEHPGGNVTAAWVPDGSRIVVLTREATVRLWDTMSADQRTMFEGDLSFQVWSPRGDAVARVSKPDAGVELWWPAQGRREVLEGHAGAVLSVAWSHDGSRIATTSVDTTVRLWRLASLAEPMVLSDHDSPVLAAAWSPDGSRIVVVSLDSTPRVWSTENIGRPVLLEGHEGLVTSARWSHDGKQILTSSADDNTARVWDVDGARRLVALPHATPISTAMWSPDGAHVITVGVGGAARIWDVTGSAASVRLGEASDWVTSAHWSPKGDRIVAGFRSGVARVWPADGQGPAVVRRVHDAFVTFAGWSHDGSRVVTSSEDGTVQIWSPDDQAEPVKLPHPHLKVRYAAFGNGDTKVVTRSSDGVARLWSADGQGEPTILPSRDGQTSYVSWSPDGTMLLTFGDHNAYVWRVDSLEDPQAVLLHDSLIKLARWGPDSQLIFTAADDKVGRVWTLDGRHTPIDLPHRGTIASAGWSPDGSRLVVAAGDMTMIASVTVPALPLMLRDQRGTALHSLVAWSPDGARILTGSEDGMVRIRTIDLDLDTLSVELAKVTTDCLGADLRELYLAETQSEADERFDACERSHGRTPLHLDDEGPTMPPIARPEKSPRSP
ncbi:MAG: hypothetical protein H6712_19110 [Myxococcales bacterium]|nr:hypothetical protein [Myxococcales bacterium]